MPKLLIEESRKLSKALGVEVADDRSSWALSFTGSKAHRLQPPIFDYMGKNIEIMDQGQVGMAALEANSNSLGYRLNGAQGEGGC